MKLISVLPDLGYDGNRVVYQDTVITAALAKHWTYTDLPWSIELIAVSASTKSQEDRPLFATEPRQFAQKRAHRTFEALVEAAMEVFAERGFDGTQTPDIAARANVSVGTFYRYFPDKREAFLEVLRRSLVQAHEAVMAELVPERFVGAGRRGTIELAIGILLDNIATPGLQKTFVEMSLRDPAVAALRNSFDTEARQRLTDLIRAICPREVVPDPEATAYIVQTAVVECAVSLAGVRGEPPVERERAFASLSDMVYRTFFGFDDVTSRSGSE